MKEDCATGMSAPHGCTDDMAVVERFMEALNERIGADRFRLWFDHVEITVAPADADEGAGKAAKDDTFVRPGSDGDIVVNVRNQFAADRMKANFLQELRGAAMHASPSKNLGVRIHVAAAPVQQALLPDATDAKAANESATATKPSRTSPKHKSAPSRANQRTGGTKSRRKSSQPIASLLDFDGRQPAAEINQQTATPRKDTPVLAPEPLAPVIAKHSRTDTNDGDEASTTIDQVAPSAKLTLSTFIHGGSNQLAYTAAQMACHSPGNATPLFLHGPTGVGKTHLMHAIADNFRRRHRMRRVVHLSAEHFTNDFIKSVGTSGLSAFRRRYRDVDALLIDDVQFVAAKKATLRELLYTIETLISAGRPLVFTANRSPSEIHGLNTELVGRMAAGLVCPVEPLCSPIRSTLMSRLIEERCPIAWNDGLVDELSGMIDGDGRLLSGVVNLVGTLQRMYKRMPTMDEIRQFGGQMLRSQAPPVTLQSIGRAVALVFDLEENQLHSNEQTRRVSEPRMLAMYLSRQLTSSAFSEIANHYGGRSHSTAIAASKKVENWIGDGKAIGRGPKALSAKQAVQRIEQILRTG